MPSPWIAAAIGAAGTAFSNVWSAREARKNREFQERMSSTAHRRQVRDLRGAGLNPILAARSGGADTPGGAMAQIEDVGRGASSALAVQRARAEIELLKSQAGREDAQAMLARTQGWELTSFAGGRAELVRMQTAVADMDARQRREMLPVLLEKAREEIGLISSSARAAEARSILDEAAAQGALNIEEFERRMGEAGPWTRFLFEVIRGLRGVAR